MNNEITVALLKLRNSERTCVIERVKEGMGLGKQARVEELRREIAEIRLKSARFQGSGVKSTADHYAEEKRLVRLREIQAELLEMMRDHQGRAH